MRGLSHPLRGSVAHVPRTRATGSPGSPDVGISAPLVLYHHRLCDEPVTRGRGMAGQVRASEEMRQGFGLTSMEPPEVVRAWFEDLFRRYDFTHPAMEYFRTLRLEAGDLSAEWGGGFWWGDQRLVQVRGAQDEAAVHELAHAYWHDARTVGNAPREMMDAVVRLSEEPDPQYARARGRAHHTAHATPPQPKKTSPPGYWRGLLVEG